MGGKNVKNTILERGLQLVAPHPCFGCEKIGTPLCDNCEYDIISEPFEGCISCGLPNRDGICSDHSSPLRRVWVASERSDVLKRFINGYKFENSKSHAARLAHLIASRLPLLPANAVLVPVPSASARIRQRGYDHIDLLTRHLSEMIQVPIERTLIRYGASVQHFLGREERLEAAKENYSLAEGVTLDPDKVYVLVDDVITTGATINSAAKVLSSARGAVFAAALAYQPLD